MNDRTALTDSEILSVRDSSGAETALSLDEWDLCFARAIESALLSKLRAEDAQDGARYRAWRDQMIRNNQPFRQALAAALPKEVGDTRPPTPAEWDAALDAAIKELS